MPCAHTKTATENSAQIKLWPHCILKHGSMCKRSKNRKKESVSVIAVRSAYSHNAPVLESPLGKRASITAGIAERRIK